ncbi:MAG: hypothetical protein RLZZ505_1907 [Verrucomicrobiota bacterium]
MFRAVKILRTLFFCLSVSPLLAADPGAAALDFLGKVREGTLDLQPGGDTALIEHITEEKRESIRKHIARLEMELRGSQLELGEVKEDDGFAAAMIRKSGGFDSADMQVFPVALVKRGDKWLAAPVPASFENAVAGYTLPIRERLAALENWMMRKRVTDLDSLLTESAKRTRELIRNSIVGEDLEGDDLGKISERFLEACAKGDRAAILGFLGGLSDPLPSDWADRMKASKAAVSNTGAWRWLVSPEIVRVRVLEERNGNEGLVLIACLDPKSAESSGIKGVHLEFSRGDAGQWRINLPDLISDPEESSDDDFDQSLLDRFSEKLRELEPALYAESARAAETVVMSDLKSSDLRKSLRRIDLGARPQDGSKASVQAAGLWWSLNEPGSFRIPVELGFREEGLLAVFAYQWFSVSEPDRFETRSLFFRKADSGWVWCSGAVPNALKREQETLKKWIEEMEPEWRLSWRETLLQPSVKLDGIHPENLPSDDQANNLVADWLEALEKKDLGAALACSAWLSDGQGIPMSALRNISYEISGANRGKAEFSGLRRSGSWVAATIRRVSGDKTQNAFLPIVMTPVGARLLPEIDLIAEDSRTRNFLNNATFGRLGKILEEDLVADLKKLFEASKKELK